MEFHHLLIIIDFPFIAHSQQITKIMLYLALNPFNSNKINLKAIEQVI